MGCLLAGRPACFPFGSADLQCPPALAAAWCTRNLSDDAAGRLAAAAAAFRPLAAEPRAHITSLPSPCSLPAPAEVDEAANRTREVVIPIIVLGPDEALHVAFDDAYLDALAAGAEADEGLECGSHCAIDAAAAAAGHACCAAGQSACGGSQEEHMQQQQAVEEPWAPGFQASIGRSSSSCRSSSSSGSAAGSPGVGQSLVQRVQCRVSQSVLSVANLMATPAAEAEAEEAEEGSVSPSPSLAAASDDGQS